MVLLLAAAGNQLLLPWEVPLLIQLKGAEAELELGQDGGGATR